jgi:hypothetical protein
VWDYCGSAASFAFFGRLPPGERRELLAALDRFARNPPLDAPVVLHDKEGRALQLWKASGFEILFWPDHSSRELRILEIEKVES